MSHYTGDIVVLGGTRMAADISKGLKETHEFRKTGKFGCGSSTVEINATLIQRFSLLFSSYTGPNATRFPLLMRRAITLSVTSPRDTPI